MIWYFFIIKIKFINENVILCFENYFGFSMIFIFDKCFFYYVGSYFVSRDYWFLKMFYDINNVLVV